MKTIGTDIEKYINIATKQIKLKTGDQNEYRSKSMMCYFNKHITSIPEGAANTARRSSDRSARTYRAVDGSFHKQKEVVQKPIIKSRKRAMKDLPLTDAANATTSRSDQFGSKDDSVLKEMHDAKKMV